MSRKLVLIMSLTIVLIGISGATLKVERVKASGTIIIKADGSIEPPDAPIDTTDMVTYYFTDNIYDEIVIERDNIVVDGAGYTLQGTGSGKGITLSGRSNVTIKNMEIKSFWDGIWLNMSSNNSISGNNVTANNEWGVSLEDSSNNTVSGNNVTNNSNGIRLDWSSINTISGNNIANNHWSGIMLLRSSNNTVSGNNVTNNYDGIGLYSSPNNILRSNSMVNNIRNFGVYFGWSPLSFVNDVDASNKVDGKPVYYWIDERDKAVPLDAGHVALVNCTHISVQNLSLAKNSDGLLLAFTTNSTISGNNIIYNRAGINLYYSLNNNISGNKITANKVYGIEVYYSSNNSIYHNNFVNNPNQVEVYDSRAHNVWDDGAGKGNYWSNYAGVDADGDGIGDTPHIIDEYNQDNYPLMSPWIPEIPEGEIPFWMQWWFWTIVAVVIVTLAGAVFFIKKRKPPTPTAPPLPLEGTV